MYRIDQKSVNRKHTLVLIGIPSQNYIGSGVGWGGGGLSAFFDTDPATTEPFIVRCKELSFLPVYISPWSVYLPSYDVSMSWCPFSTVTTPGGRRPEQRQVVGTCEHAHESSLSTKCGRFLI